MDNKGEAWGGWTAGVEMELLVWGPDWLAGHQTQSLLCSQLGETASLPCNQAGQGTALSVNSVCGGAPLPGVSPSPMCSSCSVIPCQFEADLTVTLRTMC